MDQFGSQQIRVKEPSKNPIEQTEKGKEEGEERKWWGREKERERTNVNQSQKWRESWKNMTATQKNFY